jgi:hypothetical protein
MSNTMNTLVAVATAIIGLAALAVIVSPNAETAKVISETAKGFGGVLETALSPVVGGNVYSIGK